MAEFGPVQTVQWRLTGPFNVRKTRTRAQTSRSVVTTDTIRARMTTAELAMIWSGVDGMHEHAIAGAIKTTAAIAAKIARILRTPIARVRLGPSRTRTS
jgi:hypothetical protein